MRLLVKYFILIQILGFTISSNIVIAQNLVGGVSIAEDTIPPHASAVLDVRSVGRGVLVPRITTTDEIDNLAKGLIVYVVNQNKGLFYYNGTEWKMLRSSKAYYPQGAIIMYSGDICLDDNDSACEFDSKGKGKKETRMEGWQLCNGENDSPNLQDRFIVGISTDENHPDYGTYNRVDDNNNPNSPTHTWTMSQEQLPKHSHEVPTKFIEGYEYEHTHEIKPGPHRHYIPVVTGKEESGTSYRDTKKSKKKSSKNVSKHKLGLELDKESIESFTFPSGSIKSKGGHEDDTIDPIDNRPCYYVVAFLMRKD